LNSVCNQQPHEILMEHQPDGTLASARNRAAERARGDWLCFLDADDELDSGYIAAMETVISDYERDRDSATSPIHAELYTPRVSYVRKGRAEAPRFWKHVPLEEGNWLIIGTVLPKDLFWEVGGFQEWPIYEDWALFAACHKAGARIIEVPQAVYVAHQRSDSRNKSMSRRERVQAHYEIGRSLFPERYGEEWLARHMRNAARTAA